MKTNLLSFLLVSLSFVSYAQSTSPAIPKSTTEIGFNLGHAADNAYSYDRQFRHGGFIRSSLSLLWNQGNTQYGLTIEGGTNSNDYWYVSPGLVFNHRFPSGQAYFYAGAMAGYLCSNDMVPRWAGSVKKMAHGFAFGIHGGFVQPLSKHLSFTSEVAVRSTQHWQKFKSYQYFGGAEIKETTESITVIYFPVSIGLRYNL